MFFATGSTWCIWYVQKFEFIGHATYKKRRSFDDLFLFWSCDPKWHIHAYPTGIQHIDYCYVLFELGEKGRVRGKERRGECQTLAC